MGESSSTALSWQYEDSRPILSCPDEVIELITSFLPNKDIKNVRLTNKRLRSTSILRIERVFISPSYRNIEVLYAIADHTEFRGYVKEVIWDDARYGDFIDHRVADEPVINTGEDEEEEQPGRIGIQGYEFMCYGNMDSASLVRGRTGAEPKPDEKFMTVEESFYLYLQLYKEQQEIIKAGLDVKAFRMALSAFPLLDRVVVTSEAHMRQIQYPRYPTPLLRSFPPSFDYPSSSAWTGLSHDWVMWTSWEQARGIWPGFTTVLEELAKCTRAIPELVIDVNWTSNGVGYHFFDANSHDYSHFETICSRGLKRLDLAINVAHNEDCVGMSKLHAGPLRTTLERATSIEHFSLHTSANTRQISNTFGDLVPFDGSSGSKDVLKALPIECWPLLKHLTISHIAVTASEFLLFLQQLPASLKSLQLVDIKIFDGTWAKLLQSFKDDLHWTTNKPEITIAHSQEDQSRKVWISKDIAAFLDGGENPFVGRLGENEIQWGFGTVRDDWDSTFEESWGPDEHRYT